MKVTQKAFADCVVDPKPCIQALVAAHGALKFDNEMENWELVTDLMSDQTSQTKGLGWMEERRMAADYKLVETHFNIDKPFDVKTSYTNEFLDPGIKMAKRSL